MIEIKIGEKDYPSCLEGETLYCLGNRELLSGRLITVTGAKDADNEGVSNAKKFTRELIEGGLTPVTGFAPGIEKAVAECGKCICILPCGLDEESVYPKAHLDLRNKVLENGGLLLSLEAPGTKGADWTFVKRNKLLAEISEGLVIVQAGEKSNTLKILKSSKKVYTVPGSINNIRYGGNNILLRDGAKAVMSPGDILEDFGINTEEKIENTMYDLSDIQEKVLESLEGEMHFEEIVYKTGLSLPQVLESITMLEIMGLAEETNPCTYRKIRR